MKNYLKKYCIETICLIIFFIYSLINMYKAPLLSSIYNSYFIKQNIWIIVSIFIAIIIYKIKFKFIFKYRYVLYFINILMLIYVLLFSSTTNGIKAWVKIGSITFQPSEFTKITLPICVIKLIKDKKYIKSLILFLIPSILILLEPDTGNFILLLFIYLYLLINKNNRKIILYLLGFLIISFLLAIISFIYYPEIIASLFNGALYYRFKRIMSFRNNFQINNALIGIGSAKLLPLPINRVLIYIPEGITDFIFAFNLCNYGIISSIILLTFILIFINKIIKKYKRKMYYFKKKVIGSFLTIYIIQTLYNILMNIGILPIMGIPLPFISYGGSSILTYTIFYIITNKKISSIEDMDNNSYKNNYHKVPADKHSFGYSMVR